MQYIKITYTKQNITIRVTKVIIEVRERGDISKIMKESIEKDKSWKERNKEYLKELQSFFDKAENIPDEELRKKIIGQMVRCDDILTKLAENRFQEFYKMGYKEAKKE